MAIEEGRQSISRCSTPVRTGPKLRRHEAMVTGSRRQPTQPSSERKRNQSPSQQERMERCLAGWRGRLIAKPAAELLNKVRHRIAIDHPIHAEKERISIFGKLLQDESQLPIDCS